MNDNTRLSLRRQAGQLIFFGFDGTEMNSHAIHAIRDLHLGNVILFARNFENAEQFAGLIRDLQREAAASNGIPLFVALDHEGGSVNRLTRDFTWFPGPMAIRAAGPPGLAGRVGLACGEELAACGVNLNLAPVVDLADNPDSAHIGSRSFGASPREIAPYAAAFIQGLQQSVGAAAKHFPSIGGSTVDLHLELGRNSRAAAQLEACELAPVRDAIAAGVSVVMTSHEVYAALDDCPGTLSRTLMTDCLRGRYGFEGLLLSDCMEMKALARTVPTPEACVRAVLAGVDLLLVCHTRSVQDAASDALTAAMESGRIPVERRRASLDRIMKAKRALAGPAGWAGAEPQARTAADPADRDSAEPQARIAADPAGLAAAVPAVCADANAPARPTPDPADWAGHRLLAARICEAALTVQGREEIFIPGREERFLLVCPPPAAVTALDETAGPAHLGAAVEKAFPNCVRLEYRFPMSEEEHGEILKKAAEGGFGRILFAMYQAHQDELQRRALRGLFRLDAPVGCIALRSPYDLRWCEGHSCAFLYDYTPPMTAALLRLMRGEIRAAGTLPAAVSDAVRERSLNGSEDETLH